MNWMAGSTSADKSTATQGDSPAPGDADLELRWRSYFTPVVWFFWLGISVYLTWSPFLWHLDYFNRLGPEYYRLILVVVPTLGIAALLYQFVRGRGLWRYEPALLAALLTAGFLVYQPRATLIALWLFAACYSLGRFSLSRLGLDTESHAASIALSTGIGFAALICILFVVGLIGGYYWWVFAALLSAACVLFHRQLRLLPAEIRGVFSKWASCASLRSPLVGIVMVFSAIFLLFTMMVALAPSIASDAMFFHLPAIRYYASEHALRPVPFLNYSYFPQSVESLMTLAYSLGGQPAAQIVNPLFFALSLLMVFAVARVCGIRPPPATVGVILGATIPFLHWSGSVFKNDFGWVFFQLAALFCYLRGRSSENPNWLRVGVFFVALSFGVKHVALFGAIPLVLLYLEAVRRRPRPWRLGASLALIFVTFGLFWHARTSVLTGNPIYPHRLRSATREWNPLQGTRSPLPLLYLEYPWIVHFAGGMSFESPSSNPCGIFLVVFCTLWLLVRRKSRQWREPACLFFVAAYFLYWGYIWGILRYAIVPFLLLCVFTADRLIAFYNHSPKSVRATVQGALTYTLLFAMVVAMLIEVNAPLLRLFAGRLDAEGYLREAVAGYRSVESLHGHAGPHDLILSVKNFAHGYAPIAGNFRFGLPRDRVGFVQREVRKRNYSFLIVPNGLRKQIVRALNATHVLDLFHSDQSFSVYRIRQIAAPRRERQ